ncbi:hypothetical protein [Iodobacter sp.]|uniref:hypothetical protein n=1 Tax=Iodobacter sp. TaxID=1915058 RepID=UPI0025CFF73D|nr:hypothetical protein [Iodobacter sp.]
MVNSLLKIMIVIFSISVLLLSVACQKRETNINENKATRNCYSEVMNDRNNLSKFTTDNERKMALPTAYIHKLRFTADCKVEEVEMNISLINGELSPWYKIDDPIKEIGGGLVNSSPSAVMLVRFMQNVPKLIDFEKKEIKCKPRLLIPEKGVAYFSDDDCKLSFEYEVLQFYITDVSEKKYFVNYYCNVPSKEEGGDLTTIAQLEKFNLVGPGDRCYGRGLFYPDISINFLSIRNEGKPHIDVDVEMFKQLAILLRNAYQN